MSRTASPTYLWFKEPIEGGLTVSYLCNKVVYSGQSRFQRIDVVDTRMHGRMLFLDGVGQSSERDEFIYHEMLVHPALFSCPQPRSVLVIGGAEGATLREIFRHPGITRVVMVDIDDQLIEVCKEHLTLWHQGSYQDSRLELITGDGRSYVQNCAEKFDCIIVDLSDPLEGGPAVLLFTREFYELLKNRLTPKGAIAFQGEGISPQEVALHARMVNTLEAVFPRVHPYPYSIHSFHRPDAHILVSLDPDWSLDGFVQRVETANLPLRYLSPEMARGMFSLPPYLYQAYKKHNQILTDDNCFTLAGSV
ncbi:MAG: fused MFS/spermidine synthase [Desulforhabdus sp.]|nr:fused MFS/spermidine synthase [Desulforhabdus sp.]